MIKRLFSRIRHLIKGALSGLVGIIIAAAFLIGFLYLIATLFSATYLPIKLYYTGVEKTTTVTKKTVVTSTGQYGSSSSVTYLKCPDYDFDIITHRWKVEEGDTIKVLVNTTTNYGVHYKNKKTFFRVLWHSETSYFVFILLMLFMLFALIALIVNVYYYVRKIRLISKLSVREIARQIPDPKMQFSEWSLPHKMVLYIRMMRHLLPFILSFILIILIYKMVMTGIIYSESTDKYHFVLGLALLLGIISIAFLPFKLAIWYYDFKEGKHIAVMTIKNVVAVVIGGYLVWKLIRFMTVNDLDDFHQMKHVLKELALFLVN